jgi:hypothetical protein
MSEPPSNEEAEEADLRRHVDETIAQLRLAWRHAPADGRASQSG